MVKKFRIVLIIVIIALLISITSFATSENDITNSINIEDEVVEDTEVLLDDTNEDTIWDDSYYDTMNEDYYEDDLYMANNNIDVEKDVNGNVFLVGDSVKIHNSEVVGNLFVVANEVTIDSDTIVDASAFIIADKINLVSGSAFDAYFIADEVNISNDFYISRDAKIISSKINLNGEVARNFYCISEQLNYNGSIGGKLVYSGNVTGDISSIENVEKVNIEKGGTKVAKNTYVQGKLFSYLIKIITTFVITLLTIVIVTRSLTIVSENDMYKSVKTPLDGTEVFLDILKGFGYFLLIPFIAIICMLTGIGIIVGVLLILVYILIIILAKVIACFEIAKMFEYKAKSEGNLKFIVALATVGIYVVLLCIRRIPIIGAFVSVLVFFYGFTKIVSFFLPKKQQDNSKTEIVKSEEVKNDVQEENLKEEKTENNDIENN